MYMCCTARGDLSPGQRDRRGRARGASYCFMDGKPPAPHSRMETRIVGVGEAGVGEVGVALSGTIRRYTLNKIELCRRDVGNTAQKRNFFLAPAVTQDERASSLEDQSSPYGWLAAPRCVQLGMYPAHVLCNQEKNFHSGWLAELAQEPLPPTGMRIPPSTSLRCTLLLYCGALLRAYSRYENPALSSQHLESLICLSATNNAHRHTHPHTHKPDEGISRRATYTSAIPGYRLSQRCRHEGAGRGNPSLGFQAILWWNR